MNDSPGSLDSPVAPSPDPAPKRYVTPAELDLLLLVAAIEAELPATFYAGLPPVQRIRLMVRQWNRAIKVTQTLEADLDAIKEAVAEWATPSFDLGINPPHLCPNCANPPHEGRCWRKPPKFLCVLSCQHEVGSGTNSSQIVCPTCGTLKAVVRRVSMPQTK